MFMCEEKEFIMKKTPQNSKTGEFSKVEVQVCVSLKTQRTENIPRFLVLLQAQPKTNHCTALALLCVYSHN